MPRPLVKKTYSLSRDQVRELCPSCADKMQLARIKELKLSADALGNLLPDDETTIKLFAGFSQGLCDKFGPDTGLFTRCAAAMTGKVDDEKAFCASLEKFCTGHWPAEKQHAVADMKRMTRDEVHKKCPECARLMAGNEMDLPVDNGGHMQHICGKGGRAVSPQQAAFEYDGLREYSNTIKGVEIFSSGTHNGDDYTAKDLDQMVSAFKELDYSPAIKIGHSKDTPGAPSYGWVRNLRRVGEKLYADFEDMHDSVVDALRKRLYDRVSAEIYFNLKRGGKTFSRALKAVALLGAEVPAVAKLTPLHKMEFVADGFEAVAACEQSLEVPAQAVVEALAERVTGLVNLMKEYDMAKNTEKIKVLKAQIDDINQKIVALAAKKKKKAADAEDATDAGADEEQEMKALSDEMDLVSDQLALLEAEDADAADEVVKLREDLAASQAREEAAQTERKALSERMAQLEQKDRNAQIGERVKACKIPSFRPALEAVYAYALTHTAEKVKLYSKDKDGKDQTVEHTLAEVIDGVVTEINAQSERLFKALAFSGQTVRSDGTVDEDAGKEVQKRVTEYRTKHPEVKTYEQAMSAVLAADTDLAARYREQSGIEQ